MIFPSKVKLILQSGGSRNEANRDLESYLSSYLCTKIDATFIKP
jgi:hypothetical protein